MIKKLFVQFIFAAALLTPLLTGVANAQFNPIEKPCEGVTDSAVCNEANNGQVPGEQPLVGENGILTTATNILSLVAGIIAVIIIVIAGIQMTLSGGDGQKVSNSRNTIIYAAVGIAVIIFARALVLFIINKIG
jgi:hypothetical protein